MTGNRLRGIVESWQASFTERPPWVSMRSNGARRSVGALIVLAKLAAATALSGMAAMHVAGVARCATTAPGLDADQLRKILKRLDEAGQTRPLPTKVTAQLGLTKGDETLMVREIAFERADFQHGFYKSLRTGDDHIILAFRTPEKKWTAFLTDLKFKLIAAVTWNAGEAPVPWQGAEAKQAFDNELAYWATLAEIF